MGPDIVAEIGPAAGAGHDLTRQFAPLLRAPGVAAVGGPYPIAFARLTTRGINVDAETEGRDAAPAAIDRPALTAGRWISPGGAVIERGFADALGLHVGDAFRLNGRPFRVAGIAVSTAQCFYPVSTPGVIWLTRRDAEALATSTQPLGYILNLKLDDPSSAQAFENGSAATAFYNATNNNTESFLSAWQDTERQDFKVVAVDQKVLLIVSTLLALLAVASHRGRGREPDGRADPARRPDQSGRRNATHGRDSAAGGEPRARARGHRRRRDRRPARRPGADEPRQRSARNPADAAAHRRVGARGGSGRGGGGHRRHPRPGDSRRPHEHDPRAQRPGSSAPAPGVADRALGDPASANAARSAPGRPADPPLAADRSQHDDRGYDGRGGIDARAQRRGAQPRRRDLARPPWPAGSPISCSCSARS